MKKGRPTNKEMLQRAGIDPDQPVDLRQALAPFDLSFYWQSLKASEEEANRLPPAPLTCPHCGQGLQVIVN